MDTTQMVVLFVGLGFLVLGIVFIIVGIFHRRKLSAITETRTVGAGEAAQIASPSSSSKVEVFGAAHSDQPLVAPLSNRECVYFRLKVEELRVDYDTDSSGRRTRSERWTTIADEKRYAPFFISDSTGRVAVDAEKAKFEAEQTVRDAYGAPGYDPSRGSSMGGVLGDVLGSVLGMETTRGVRSSEWIVPAGQPTYVLGNVVRSGEESVITKGEGPFIVSVKSEEELTKKYRLHYMLWTGFGAFFAAGGAVAAIIAGTVLKK